MMKMGSLFFLSFVWSLSLQANDTTNAGTGDRNRFSPQYQRAAQELERKIMCGFEKNGMREGPTVQRQRAEYVSRHLSDLMVRLADPRWQEPATQHLLAQVVAETGNLRLLEEQPSEYASSQMNHRGRGIMQTTFRENYARLAGCTREVQNTPIPAVITWDDIASAPSLSNSPLVSNPDAGMTENTEQGRLYNAMSGACYFIDTAVRHPEFAQALQCREDSCIDEVGVAVNRGPGRLGEGRQPLGAAKRREAFRKMEECFSPARSPFIGV